MPFLQIPKKLENIEKMVDALSKPLA